MNFVLVQTSFRVRRLIRLLFWMFAAAAGAGVVAGAFESRTNTNAATIFGLLQSSAASDVGAYIAAFVFAIICVHLLQCAGLPCAQQTNPPQSAWADLRAICDWCDRPRAIGAWYDRFDIDPSGRTL